MHDRMERGCACGGTREEMHDRMERRVSHEEMHRHAREEMHNRMERGCACGGAHEEMHRHTCEEMHDRMERDCRDTRAEGEADWRAGVPVGSRQRLLAYLNEVSFAAYEALLYLDTHPEDHEALHYFQEHSRRRNYALQAYAKAFGPLNMDVMDDDHAGQWDWACQPWPWEGGRA